MKVNELLDHAQKLYKTNLFLKEKNNHKSKIKISLTPSPYNGIFRKVAKTSVLATFSSHYPCESPLSCNQLFQQNLQSIPKKNL